MNLKLPETEIGLRRCAICKIDLKGRFVFIDDTVENLLELNKEELFGKSVFEFLDSHSIDLVNQIINQRNRYESFFDSAELTLISINKHVIPTRAIISLNFNAGNPVNFQFILDSLDAAPAASVLIENNNNENLSAFIEEILSGDQSHDLKDLVRSLSKLTMAEMTIGYIHQNNQLVPFEVVDGNDFIQRQPHELPGLSQLHVDLAVNRMMYNFLDDESVRIAVEKYGSAPNEFIIPFDFDLDSTCLIRFIFKANGNRSEIADGIKKICLGISLLQRIILDKEAENQPDSSFDIRFVIGFLDSLNIPAFLLDSGGQITGYNPGMLKYFKEEELSGSYVKLLNRMKDFNDDRMVSKIIDYVTSSYEDGGNDDIQFNLKLAPGLQKQLSVLKFSDKALDLSSCFVFMPGFKIPSDSSPKIAIDQNQTENAVEILKTVLSQTETIHNKSIRLTHSFYNELGEEGNQLLGEIDSSFNAFSKQINNYLTIVNQTEDHRAVECHDLNLLLDDILKKLTQQYDGSNINCAFTHLPKIKCQGFYVKALLYSWLENLVGTKNRKNINLSVKADADEKQLRLIIEDDIIKSTKAVDLNENQVLLKKFSANAIKCESFKTILAQLEGRISFDEQDDGRHRVEIVLDLK